MTKPNILVFDIETAPNVGHIWQFFKANINADQLLKDGYIIAFAAKWLGSDDVIYEESRTENDKPLVRKLAKLLDQADIVIGHNGDRFDLGWVKFRAAVHGIKPWSPVKVIDTYKIAKKEFYSPSYRLEYLARLFKCTPKESHKKFPGHKLWVGCVVDKDEAAWEEMRVYNIQDVLTLEELYYKMRPYMTQHPNMGVYIESDKPVCSKCGSEGMRKDGFHYTATGKYQQYQCSSKDCGGWARGRYNLYSPDSRKELLTNVTGR